MHFRAPAPKREHTLWQCNKSYPASVGLSRAVRAFQSSCAETRSQPVNTQQKLPSLCCALRGCARIRGQILKIRCARAESRCVVLCPDMFGIAALPARFVRGLRHIWPLSRQLQLPASSARTAVSSQDTFACAVAFGSADTAPALPLPTCVWPTSKLLARCVCTALPCGLP